MFLAALSKIGVITHAAFQAGVYRETVHRHRKRYPDFDKACREALEEAADHLETAAIKRAMIGWKEPVFQKGEQVGEVIKYSDGLLMFMLKAVRPEKFREKHEFSGRIDGTMTLTPGQTAALDAIYGDAATKPDGTERDGAGEPEPG